MRGPWGREALGREVVGPTGRRADGRRSGVTLPELLVVFVILTLVSGIGAMSVVALKQTPEAARLDSLRAARAEAIREGRPVTIVFDSVPVRFLPDGQVLGGPIDRLTGEVHHAQ